MSSPLTRLTVGACLAAIPVFMPIAVHPDMALGGGAATPLVVDAQTRYVLAQSSIMLAAAQTTVAAPQRHRRPATIDTNQKVLPGGLSQLGTIPAVALAAYQGAAQRQAGVTPGCHLSWQVLAGIGEVESHHAASGGSSDPAWSGIAHPRILGPLLNGRVGQAVHDTDHGRLDGNRTWDRAVGPMQFLPSTWTSYGVDADGDGQADPEDIRDAAAAAGGYLCKGGVDLNNAAQLAQAVFSYNHAHWYVSEVLTIAASYGGQSVTGAGSVTAVNTAIAFAYAHLGDPYLWGGNGPLYDCSGFTQAAYAAAGIAIPRTSEQQWLSLPHVPDGQLEPGDLVFFNPGEFVAGLPGHVGIYLGGGYMINDPHTGAVVSIRSITGAGVYVGATRPAVLPAGKPLPTGSAGSAGSDATGGGDATGHHHGGGSGSSGSGGTSGSGTGSGSGSGSGSSGSSGGSGGKGGGGGGSGSGGGGGTGSGGTGGGGSGSGSGSGSGGTGSGTGTGTGGSTGGSTGSGGSSGGGGDVGGDPVPTPTRGPLPGPSSSPSS